jgi:hypothetical protein
MSEESQARAAAWISTAFDVAARVFRILWWIAVLTLLVVGLATEQ